MAEPASLAITPSRHGSLRADYSGTGLRTISVAAAAGCIFRNEKGREYTVRCLLGRRVCVSEVSNERRCVERRLREVLV